MGYVYRVEKIARLLGLNEPVLRMERQFGPPHDFPHKMLETVRKQLPTSRAVYKLECLKLLPRAPSSWDIDGQVRVVLRIPERNVLFADLTRIPDERAPSTGVVYFGVDEAGGPTNRMSPNLYVPFEKIDVQIGNKWLCLTPRVLVALARNGGPFSSLSVDEQVIGRAA